MVEPQEQPVLPPVLPSSPRLLLNAQPFGSGPAAAASILAAELARAGARVDYIGSGHTPDLQVAPPYRAVHDITGLPKGELVNRLRGTAPLYDAFVTAMDFAMAELAVRAGLKVVIYDALTWYWPEIPPVAHEAALYIAQDFFGVRERLASDPVLRERSVIVPPIIPAAQEHRPGEHVLLNLGGLENPFWRAEDAAVYARIMLTAMRAVLPADAMVIVSASRNVVRALDDPDVATYDRYAVLHLMSTARYAWMTPGLGNVYDAAATGVPTLWLPGANETQHLQARLLFEHHCCDALVCWDDIGRSVDYLASPPEAARQVTRVVRQVSREWSLRARFTALLAERTADLGIAPSGKARALIGLFGHGGVQPAAAAMVRRVKGAPVTGVLPHQEPMTGSIEVSSEPTAR